MTWCAAICNGYWRHLGIHNLALKTLAHFSSWCVKSSDWTNLLLKFPALWSFLFFSHEHLQTLTTGCEETAHTCCECVQHKHWVRLHARSYSRSFSNACWDIRKFSFQSLSVNSVKTTHSHQSLLRMHIQLERALRDRGGGNISYILMLSYPNTAQKLVDDSRSRWRNIKIKKNVAASTSTADKRRYIVVTSDRFPAGIHIIGYVLI